MGRAARVAVGNEVYHVINRAVGRLKIFDDAEDYQLFLDLIEEARERANMRVLSFVVMPNHWHLQLYPYDDGDLAEFMHWLTNAHTRKVHAKTKTTGTGPLYQGRYKSFIIESDSHLLAVLKYIERNPVRAKLASTPQEWKWGSAWMRDNPAGRGIVALSELPVPLPSNYLEWIEQDDRAEDLESIRISAHKGKPFGTSLWVDQMVESYRLEATVRAPGRPKS